MKRYVVTFLMCDKDEFRRMLTHYTRAQSELEARGLMMLRMQKEGFEINDVVDEVCIEIPEGDARMRLSDGKSTSRKGDL